jgi:hypothetical protein
MATGQNAEKNEVKPAARCQKQESDNETFEPLNAEPGTFNCEAD